MPSLSTDPVTREAIRLRDKLKDVAKEVGYRDARTEAAKTMRDFDQNVCLDAAKMLEKLGTEQTRLRLLIWHFVDGFGSKEELRAAIKTWNDGTPF